VATQAQRREPTVEDTLKKIREDIEKMLKEGGSIASSAQQSLQQLNRLSEELRKLAEELKKPPKPSTPSTTAR